MGARLSGNGGSNGMRFTRVAALSLGLLAMKFCRVGLTFEFGGSV